MAFFASISHPCAQANVRSLVEGHRDRLRKAGQGVATLYSGKHTHIHVGALSRFAWNTRAKGGSDSENVLLLYSFASPRSGSNRSSDGVRLEGCRRVSKRPGAGIGAKLQRISRAYWQGDFRTGAAGGLPSRSGRCALHTVNYAACYARANDECFMSPYVLFLFRVLLHYPSHSNPSK